jgi:hypothetical protein
MRGQTHFSQQRQLPPAKPEISRSGRGLLDHAGAEEFAGPQPSYSRKASIFPKSSLLSWPFATFSLLLLGAVLAFDNHVRMNRLQAELEEKTRECKYYEIELGRTMSEVQLSLKAEYDADLQRLHEDYQTLMRKCGLSQ